MKDKLHREFYKEKENSKIWRVEEYTINDDGIMEMEKGLMLFSFHKEEKEIFDKEYPFWSSFFKKDNNIVL